MNDTPLMCPSSPWDTPDGKVFGIVAGTVEKPEVHYLKETLDATPELVAKLNGEDPGEVLRVAAPCAKTACKHHDGEAHQCTLVSRIVSTVPIMFVGRAPCAIRSTCLWWAQEGAEACKRCPKVVTHPRVIADTDLALAAAPPKQVTDLSA
ncbi:nitrogen fixation protein [Parachitinimonas caeni]|uniref:Nitrogen fixation protein n=1 Tax=Parachitinimonas caeni TaxID=3031301 RepID=A0ABT7DXU0_9NEIS|nr:nitrogen fixation protein [Parachitinimonas caeni]MDK2123985.1 nitrogen fixation protein [Parachitinimonas caeni]